MAINTEVSRETAFGDVSFTTDGRTTIGTQSQIQANATDVVDGNDLVHEAVGNHQSRACIECGDLFPSQYRLRLHANEAQHSPFACKCGQKFARRDVLQRHIVSQGSALPRYPCTHCKLHRGKNGFRRRDHLLQHIRGYHKLDSDNFLLDLNPRQTKQHEVIFCRHPSCEYHRDDTFRKLPWHSQLENRPFRNKSEHTKHLKDVHGETAFPCNVPGCERVGSKGYSREKDLINHRVKTHSGLERYLPKPRQTRRKCPAGCGKFFSPNHVSSCYSLK